MRVFKRSILLFCTLILTFSIISTSIQTKSRFFVSGKADDLVSYYGISNQVTKSHIEEYIEVMNVWGYHSYINASMISNVFNGNITTPIKIND
ncbi:MAG: hypothetical protein GX312_04970 [Candidatus Phytoplasma sp.]|nr:hypothetical protein [Phytoplasma sp.]